MFHIKLPNQKQTNTQHHIHRYVELLKLKNFRSPRLQIGKPISSFQLPCRAAIVMFFIFYIRSNIHKVQKVTQLHFFKRTINPFRRGRNGLTCLQDQAFQKFRNNFNTFSCRVTTSRSIRACFYHNAIIGRIFNPILIQWSKVEKSIFETFYPSQYYLSQLILCLMFILDEENCQILQLFKVLIPEVI